MSVSHDLSHLESYLIVPFNSHQEDKNSFLIKSYASLSFPSGCCPAPTLFSSITCLCVLSAHTSTWVMLCGLCREPQYDAYLQGMASSRRAWGDMICIFSAVWVVKGAAVLPRNRGCLFQSWKCCWRCLGVPLIQIQEHLILQPRFKWKTGILFPSLFSLFFCINIDLSAGYSTYKTTVHS